LQEFVRGEKREVAIYDASERCDMFTRDRRKLGGEHFGTEKAQESNFNVMYVTERYLRVDQVFAKPILEYVVSWYD
jgi:hypothetical protein